jgi:nucleoside 2-deoxyribosyltransferase
VNRIYYISPVGADPGYANKRQVLARIASSRDVTFFFPLDRHQSFSVSMALNDLRASQLVVADLSLARPSCYFEVGLAQATGTPVALIAEAGTVLHQAGGTERVVTYADLASYQAAVEQALSHLYRGDA